MAVFSELSTGCKWRVRARAVEECKGTEHILLFYFCPLEFPLTTDPINRKDDVVYVVHLLSRDVKMTSLINKSTDWPPNYHKIPIFSLKRPH